MKKTITISVIAATCFLLAWFFAVSHRDESGKGGDGASPERSAYVFEPSANAPGGGGHSSEKEKTPTHIFEPEGRGGEGASSEKEKTAAYVFEPNWWTRPQTYGMFNYYAATNYARLEAVRATVNGYRLLYDPDEFDYKKDAEAAHEKGIKYVTGMLFKIKKDKADGGSTCLPYGEIEADSARKAEKIVDFGVDGLAVIHPFGDDLFMEKGLSCLCPEGLAKNLSRENQLECAVEFYRRFVAGVKDYARAKGENNFPVSVASHGEWLIPLTIDMLPFSDFAFANLNFEHYAHPHLYKLHSSAVKKGGGLIASPVDASFGWLMEKTKRPEDLIKIKMAEAYANKGAFHDQHEAGLSPDCVGRESFSEKCWLDASAKAAAVGSVNSFYLSNKNLFAGDFESTAKIAVLFSAKSVKDNLSDHWRIFNGVSRGLSEYGFQYDVIFSNDSRFSPNTLGADRLRKYELIILPNNNVMDASAIAAVSAFLKGGGKVIATNSVDSELASSKIFSSRAERFDYKDDYNGPRELATLLNGKMDKIAKVAFQAKTGVQIWKEYSGKMIVHLVNYDFDPNEGALARKNISVSIKLPSPKKPSSVRMISPDLERMKKLKFDYAAGEVRFTVPELKIWDVLIIE